MEREGVGGQMKTTLCRSSLCIEWANNVLVTRDCDLDIYEDAIHDLFIIRHILSVTAAPMPRN